MTPVSTISGQDAEGGAELLTNEYKEASTARCDHSPRILRPNSLVLDLEQSSYSAGIKF
jgi:hypothetical protein